MEIGRPLREIEAPAPVQQPREEPAREETPVPEQAPDLVPA